MAKTLLEDQCCLMVCHNGEHTNISITLLGGDKRAAIIPKLSSFFLKEYSCAQQPSTSSPCFSASCQGYRRINMTKKDLFQQTFAEIRYTYEQQLYFLIQN